MKITAGSVYRLLTALNAIFLMASPAFATGSGSNSGSKQGRMDAEIHTVVIDKLERSLQRARENETVSLKPVRARLADLYADRARLRAMDEAERSCQDCTGALSDRKRALKLYDSVLNEAPKQNRGPLLLQMAQLHELNNEYKKSEVLYERVVAEGTRRHEVSVVAEALIGKAERRFSRGDVDRAQRDFETALRMVDAGRKGPILHRIAWCHLNKGEQPRAVRTLIQVLETPDLLTRESTEGESFDVSFQEDVARDLATFLARGHVSSKEIALLESHAPERAKKDILKHFAQECDRLGQKAASIDAWAAVARYETDSADRIETMLRVAQLRFELGQKPEALRDLQNTSAYWNKNGCDDEERCAVFQGAMRSLVISWNRAEKKQPTALLLEAYLAYLNSFDEDMEMTQWAAEIARVKKRYPQAAVLFHRASLLAAAEMKPGSKSKGAKQILESALVGEVEMAELSKDPRTRELSYNHYLTLSPRGAMALKVRYQRAHVAYERGDTREASNRFYSFAVSQDCRDRGSKEDLCVKAADLDIDSLVGLNDHAAVQTRANEYSRIYSLRRGEFLKISRTAVLKQAEREEPAVALAKLNEADLSGASTEERVRFLKIRLAAAEKAKDLNEVRNTAEVLLRTKGLSSTDVEFAMGKQAWASEMVLDFSTAYEISRRMRLSALRADERAMKLALLAELSGRSPRQHENDFLRVSRDSFQKAFVRAKLVRGSTQPLRELAQHDSQLRAYPQLYASLALEIFAKTGDRKFASRALKVRGVSAQPAGRVLAREIFLSEFSALERQLAGHKIRSTSDVIMQRSLTERLKMLGKAEREANQAIGSRDWTAQIVALSLLKRENKRVYSDIVGLPVPRKLKGKGRENYVRLVESSARGYLSKADQIERKLTLLWGDHAAQTALSNDYQQARPEVRSVLAGQVRTLTQLAPNGIRRELESDLRGVATAPSEQQVASARRDARAQPFSASTLAKLRDLEDSRGRETMVAYLDARLLKLEESKAGEKR